MTRSDVSRGLRSLAAIAVGAALAAPAVARAEAATGAAASTAAAAPGAPATIAAPAAAAPPSLDPATVFTLRFQLPATGFIRWGQDGGFTMFGLSESMRFAHLIEVEAGATSVINPCADGGQLTLRAGLSPSVVTARASGTHWNLRLPVLASAHLVLVSGDGCDGHTETSGTPLTLAAGIDATYWSASGRSGLNLRLLAGLGDRGWNEAALTIGISFR